MTSFPFRRAPLRLAWRGELAQVACGLLVAAIAVGATVVADDHGLGRGAAIAACAGTLVWFAVTRRTGLALALLMAYLGVLDGYLKLSTGIELVKLLRDALLFALVVGLLVRAQVQGTTFRAPPLTGYIVVFVALVLVQFANPLAGTLTHSLAGARQHLEFIPLFFLTFAFARTTKALRVFALVLVLVAAANGIAGLAQFRLTTEQFAAWGPGYAERVLGQGQFGDAGRSFASRAGTDLVRPFGLGSDTGFGGVVGAFALGAVLVLIARAKRLRHLLFAVAMSLGATAAVVTSQARSAVISAVIVVFAYGVLALTSRIRVSTVISFAVGGLAALLVVQGVIGSLGSSSFRYQGLGSDLVQTTATARGSSIARIPRILATYPLGAGLGTGGVASGYAGASELAGVVDTETWFAFETVETGLAGMLVMLGFTVALLWLGVTRCRNEPDDEARVLLAATIAPIAAILATYLIAGGVTATSPGAPYLWAVGGIVSYWLIARPAELRSAAARV